MSHANLMAATKRLEEAIDDQEKARLVWLVNRVAHPGVVDIDLAEAYCDAANAVANAQSDWDAACIDAQADALRMDMTGEAS
jgi:hypothetical protein